MRLFWRVFLHPVLILVIVALAIAAAVRLS